MPEDELRYDRMVEEALRSVVNRALGHVAEHGLPGDHHFYITFRTDHPDVRIPGHLRERYPNEMTIVLQYQFSDLAVGPDSFSVTLTFSGVPAKLVVPFDAVAAFADPSVRFGLQFDIGESEQKAPEAPGKRAEPAAPQASEGPRDKAAAKPAGEQAAEDDDTDEGPAESEKIVTLDAFRKK
ncbi:MAG TPA: ClpXP protease specificity-enhancing factor SspB [Kiloniellales bacterium]|nr:ClpXP protease specificity-enhancing factor SspB [Kiloniellales bacterium]